MSNNEGAAVTEVLESIVEKPERFLVLPDEDLYSKIMKNLTKWLHETVKASEPHEMSPLAELLVDNFAIEQIWSQIHLQNVPMLRFLEEKVEAVLERGDIPGDADDDDDNNDENLADIDLNGVEEEEEEELEEEDYEEDLDDMDDDAESTSLKRARETNSDDDNDLYDDDDDGQDEEEEGAEFDESEAEDFESEEESQAKPSRPGRRTIVDDEFFSLDLMEKFAEKGEARDLARAEGKDVDNDDWNFNSAYFGMDPDEITPSDEEDVDVNDIRYEDYFLPPEDSKKKQSKSKRSASSATDRNGSVKFNDIPEEREFNKDAPPQAVGMSEDESDISAEIQKKMLFGDHDEEEDEDGQEDATRLTPFQREQLKLRKQIEELEKEAISEKPWAMRGEVSSKTRPENSLLETDLEVENAVRPTPVITEETTASLEELIKSRIRDALFDDVERKVDPRKKREFDPNRKPIIDEQKSSKSLAEEYEADYLRQSAGSQFKSENTVALEKAHQEIDVLLEELNTSLDALSNWHFAPKPKMAELEIVVQPSVPALSVEEVIPAVVSDAVAAAPKEVYAGRVAKSAEEMDPNDKRKARLKQKRANKKRKIERAKQLQAKEKEGKSLEGNTKQSKERAVQSLMKQSNVTIIGDESLMGKNKNKNKKEISRPQAENLRL